MTEAMFVDGSVAAAHSSNNAVATSTVQCSCDNRIKKSVVRNAVKQYGDHYIDVWAEDIANEVKYRPTTGKPIVCTP